ncbi:hypothetical protein [Gandjariella thermophila]|uniref:Peptidase MA-like domain-containing protein n=1 Tax=Gandjariella thermophila TaxID=1931992 RepID=A0A4D4J5L6_9PSEU|nr:hypothetical protein [Gandjariella thermophila]GDY30380.1 hypothetical protein GTS_20130 [Gandjariella thermophila]
MTGDTRFRAWLVAAVAAVLLAGLVLVSPAGLLRDGAAPSGVDGPAGHRSGSAAALAVADLLHRRAVAVLGRDEAGFMATVDPGADPSFRAAQRALFRDLGGVPLRVWEYRVDPDDALDPGSPAALAGADELWAPRVVLRYALAEVDEVPTTRPMGYLFDRRGPDWYLASDTALAAAGRDTWRGPWDFGPCLVRHTRSGLVIAHPGAEGTALADRVAAELDAAVGAVAAVWGAGWPRRVAVLVPAGGAEMRALVGPEFSVDAIAAVAIADRVSLAGHTAEGQRVVLNADTAGRMSTQTLRVVLRHEVTHVAARAATVDGAPMWLLEGFADYLGYRDSGIPLAQAAGDLADLVRAGRTPDALPDDADFRAGAARLDLAYQEAWTAVRYLAERVGEPRLVELYRRIAGLARPSWSEVDAALRAVAGIDHAGLVAGWRNYLSGHLGSAGATGDR